MIKEQTYYNHQIIDKEISFDKAVKIIISKSLDSKYTHIHTVYTTDPVNGVLVNQKCNWDNNNFSCELIQQAFVLSDKVNYLSFNKFANITFNNRCRNAFSIIFNDLNLEFIFS